MDVRPELALPPDHSPAPTLLDSAELRRLLSHLSHELCRPLISLRAGFDLLLGDNAPPISADQRGHLRMMVVLCDEMLHLTRSYLDYAGLVRGARPMHYGSYTLGALVREIDHEFAPTAAARRIDWRCGLDGRDAPVHTDAARCQQIFGNLVANALKYTPEGGEIRVAAGCSGRTWSLTVSDTGLGIPADALAKVFEPFFRLPRDERSGVEGSGLGLPICRELVGQLGGEITISSELGKGTRVVVRFPNEPESGRPHGPRPG